MARRYPRSGELELAILDAVDEVGERLPVEAGLLRPVGGDAVMAAQLDQLLEMNEHRTVNLVALLLRLGAHPGLGGAFQMLTFQEDNDLDVVFIETPATDFLLTDAADTATSSRS